MVARLEAQGRNMAAALVPMLQNVQAQGGGVRGQRPCDYGCADELEDSYFGYGVYLTTTWTLSSNAS